MQIRALHPTGASPVPRLVAGHSSGRARSSRTVYPAQQDTAVLLRSTASPLLLGCVKNL